MLILSAMSEDGRGALKVKIAKVELGLDQRV